MPDFNPAFVSGVLAIILATALVLIITLRLDAAEKRLDTWIEQFKKEAEHRHKMQMSNLELFRETYLALEELQEDVNKLKEVPNDAH